MTGSPHGGEARGSARDPAGPSGISRGFRSKKYPPFLSAKSGDSANQTSVSAPLAGERENCLVRAMPKLISGPLLWLKLVATLPGW